jgi:signal transduction histidine kinase
MKVSEILREFRRSGTFTYFFLAILAIVVALLFNAIRPPTVEEVERDIWQDWTRATVDTQGENIAGLLRYDRQAACEQLIKSFGRTVVEHGDRFVVRTDIRLIRVLTPAGKVFAEWHPDRSEDTDGYGWRDLVLPLGDEGEKPVGTIEVVYRFNESNLGALPNIRRLAELHNAARWLVAVIAVVMLIAAIANLQRLRERAARLQSQQVTLDLARQMCHELRNGLWAFSLEGKNIRQLLELIDSYFQSEPAALSEAAARIGMTDRDFERFRRQVKKHLATLHLDPETDVLAANDMAKDAQRQIESFSRYINLTVEQLDRNLLGTAWAWEPVTVRCLDAWHEACELLHLRFHSAGVECVEGIETNDDWLFVDRRALVHVFVNLAKNAIEAMRESPDGRILTFHLRRVDSIVECTIHNVGKPIPVTLLPFIFNRGFSTKAGAGRGIGLALVGESVTRMEGQISVTSNETGTSFQLRIPYQPPTRNPIANDSDVAAIDNQLARPTAS